MDYKTLRGLCIIAFSVIGTFAVVAMTPAISPETVGQAFAPAAAVEAEPIAPSSEPATPVVEYVFDDDEGLVIEGCAPPACSEVSFTEAEAEPVVVRRPPVNRALARR